MLGTGLSVAVKAAVKAAVKGVLLGAWQGKARLKCNELDNLGHQHLSYSAWRHTQHTVTSHWLLNSNVQKIHFPLGLNQNHLCIFVNSNCWLIFLLEAIYEIFMWQEASQQWCANLAELLRRVLPSYNNIVAALIVKYTAPLHSFQGPTLGASATDPLVLFVIIRSLLPGPSTTHIFVYFIMLWEFRHCFIFAGFSTIHNTKKTCQDLFTAQFRSC